MQNHGNKNTNKVVNVLIFIGIVSVWAIGMFVVPKMWSKHQLTETCKAKNGTVETGAIGNYKYGNEKGYQIEVTGFSSEPQSTIFVDNNDVGISENSIDPTCVNSGVEVYQIKYNAKIPSCGGEKVGFYMDGKKIETNLNGMPCTEEPWLSRDENDVNQSTPESKPSPKPTTQKAYGSDPNDPDTYTGAGASIEDKQIRAHILCKKYAEDYFYPSKVKFHSVAGVVTDEEQYYGWRYDVMLDVKSAAGDKQSYIMHCIAGSFDNDYSSGKVTWFEALKR